MPGPDALTQLSQQLDFPRRLSSADYVQHILREAILRGVLRAGQPLRQEDIAAQLDVSRIPVREALMKLEAQGLVTFYHNRGAVVSDLSAEEVEEICEIRSALETKALTLAFPYLTAADLDQARQIITATEAQTDISRWGQLNWAFHETLYRPAGRLRLLDMIHTLHINVDRYLRLQLSILDYKPRSQREHRAILEACRRGDRTAAVDRLEQHICAASQQLAAHLRHKE